MFRSLFLFGLLHFATSNKLAADSPAAIFINRATLGNDSEVADAGVGGSNVKDLAFINVASEPYVNLIPQDIQDACAKIETPEQQFTRVTEQKNDSMDFGQFLQLDGCGVAWRKHDFNKIDTNHDSKISADEWNAHNAELKRAMEAAILDHQKFTFDRIDTNNDKLLNKKELTKYLNQRMIESGNLTEYLNGGKLNFTQFVDFDTSIPNGTFPFKSIDPNFDYSAPSYAYDYAIPDDSELGIQVDPLPNKPQPRPAFSPAVDVMPLPAKPPKGDQMAIQIQPIGGGFARPAILPAVDVMPLPAKSDQMSTQVEPHNEPGLVGAPAPGAADTMSAAVMPH